MSAQIASAAFERFVARTQFAQPVAFMISVPLISASPSLVESA